MGPTRQKCPFPQAYHHHHMGFLHGGLHYDTGDTRRYSHTSSPHARGFEAAACCFQLGSHQPCVPAPSPRRAPRPGRLSEQDLEARNPAPRPALQAASAPLPAFRRPFCTPSARQPAAQNTLPGHDTAACPEIHTTNAHFGAEKRTGGPAGPWARLAGGEGLQAVGGAEAKPPPRPCPDTYPSHSGPARPARPATSCPPPPPGTAAPGTRAAGRRVPGGSHAWAAAAGHEGSAPGHGGRRSSPSAVSHHHLPLGRPCPARPPAAPPPRPRPYLSPRRPPGCCSRPREEQMARNRAQRGGLRRRAAAEHVGRPRPTLAREFERERGSRAARPPSSPTKGRLRWRPSSGNYISAAGASPADGPRLSGGKFQRGNESHAD